MNGTLRAPLESDWPAILNVAHAAAPWAGDKNLEWLHNRRQFDDKAWRRRHYVIEDGATQQVIGYGGVEEGPRPGIFRVFVVLSPERLTGGLGQYLYDHLRADLGELGADRVWAREEGRDTALLIFFTQQQFVETSRATLPDGMEVVFMEHPLDATLRQASIDDAEAVTALTDAAYAKHIPRIGRKPQPMTADYRQMISDHHVWLLCLADEPIGVLVLMNEPDQALIYSVAVSPKYQKQGWGRYLLGWAEGQARREGYNRIRLYTNARMEENIALYKRLGYTETGREDFLGSTLVHMAKQLQYHANSSL